MTDEEFKTWDRHKAENLQSQVDDTLKRISDAAEERAKLIGEHNAEIAEFEAEHAAHLAVVADFRDKTTEKDKEIEKLLKEVSHWKLRCESMESHPEVVAARREIAKAKALEQKAAAEKVLNELG